MKKNKPFWIRAIDADSETTGGSAPQSTPEQETDNGNEPAKDQPQDDQSDSTDELEKLKTARAQLEKERDEWRGHSRDWEKQSKDNLKRVKELETKLEESISAETLSNIQAERDNLNKQLSIVNGLLSMGADARELTDSRSFMEKAEQLDPRDEEFTETLTALVGEHRQRYPHSRQVYFENASGTQKTDLWTLVHGAKDEKKGL